MSEALNTASTPSRAGSASAPTVSSTSIVREPGAAPLSGKVTFCPMSSADPRANSGVEARRRSRSRAWPLADAMSAGAGLREASSRSGLMIGHLSPFFEATGRPAPKPLSCPVQSMALKWSPELNESRSRDFERRISVPDDQNEGDWPRATVASDRVFMRTRSPIGTDVGSLYVSRSKSVSLSWAST